MQHTWQTELNKELQSVVDGFKEAYKSTGDIEKLVADIKNSVLTDTGEIAKKLIDLKLGYFASKLLGEGYHHMAEMENQAEPLNVEHKGDNENEESEPIKPVEAVETGKTSETAADSSAEPASV